MGLPLVVKIIIAASLIAPLGFAMGLPFPLGLSRLAVEAPDLVPWASDRSEPQTATAWFSPHRRLCKRSCSCPVGGSPGRTATQRCDCDQHGSPLVTWQRSTQTGRWFRLDPW